VDVEPVKSPPWLGKNNSNLKLQPFVFELFARNKKGETESGFTFFCWSSFGLIFCNEIKIQM